MGRNTELFSRIRENCGQSGDQMQMSTRSEEAHGFAQPSVAHISNVRDQRHGFKRRAWQFLALLVAMVAYAAVTVSIEVYAWLGDLTDRVKRNKAFGPKTVRQHPQDCSVRT